MIRVRLIAAAAALLTALLAQATLIGPLTMPAATSLPAVLVAAIALSQGPGAGIAFGFSCGLIADLGSHHPAGVLALTWLAVGLCAGRIGDRLRTPAAASLTAAICTVLAVLSTLLLRILHAAGASGVEAVRQAIPTFLGDLVLALLIVPLTARVLRSHALRPPYRVRPVRPAAEPGVVSGAAAAGRSGLRSAERGRV